MREFPDLPERMQSLPRDHRGFPVPWFVAWIKDGMTAQDVDSAYSVNDLLKPNSTPDFRVIALDALSVAHKQRRCWICGKVRGKFSCYVIGPMCAVNRVTSEPGSHLECAEFAAKNCPFLANPRMRRNENDMEGMKSPGGIAIDRNPGATCLWISDKDAKPWRPEGGGVLFQLQDPTEVRWYASGRQATREEVTHSIETGLPTLLGVAAEEGPEAIAALADMHHDMLKYLPEAVT